MTCIVSSGALNSTHSRVSTRVEALDAGFDAHFVSFIFSDGAIPFRDVSDVVSDCNVLQVLYEGEQVRVCHQNPVPCTY